VRAGLPLWELRAVVAEEGVREHVAQAGLRQSAKSGTSVWSGERGDRRGGHGYGKRFYRERRQRHERGGRHAHVSATEVARGEV
jgi:hypothetical protein